MKSMGYLCLLLFLVSGVSDIPILSLKEDLVIGRDDADPQKTFYGLSGSATDSAGNFYLIDQGNSRIQVFDSAGRFLRTIGRPGQGPGELTAPAAAVVCGAAVVVANESKVIAFDRDGRYRSSFDVGGLICDMIRVSDDIVRIAAPRANGRFLHDWSLQGQALNSFGDLGEPDIARFNDAVKICSDEAGNTYSVFRYVNRVQKYDPQGRLLDQVKVPLPFEAVSFKRGDVEVRSIFLDIACDRRSVFMLTAPVSQKDGKPDLTSGNYLVALDETLRHVKTWQLPFLALALAFDRTDRFLLCDIDFRFFVGRPQTPLL